MSKFDDLIATEKLFNKKTFFDMNCPKHFNSFKNCLESTKTAKQHKNRKAIKNLKKRKTYLEVILIENCLEVILIFNKVKFLNGKVSLTNLF